MLYFNKVLTGLVGLSIFSKGCWAPGIHLDFDRIYTPSAPSRMQTLKEPDSEKALQILHGLWELPISGSKMQNAELLQIPYSGELEVLRPLRMWPSTGRVWLWWWYTSLWLRFCWRYLNSHQVALLNTEKHSRSETEFGQRSQSEKHVGSNGIKAAPMIFR